MYISMNRCVTYTQKYRTVNTVYIEYKSVVSHSLTHTHVAACTV